MGNTEELERLAALRDKGALTEEEFQKAKTDLLTPKKKKSAIRTLVTWALGLFIVFAAGSALLSVMGGGGGVPSCDSSDAKKTLMQAFDGSQFARTLNLSAIDVSKPTEAKYDANKKARECAALVKMNNTAEVGVKYSMERKEGGRFLLTFEVTDANPSAQASAGSAPGKVEPMASVPKAEAGIQGAAAVDLAKFLGQHPATLVDEPSIQRRFQELLGPKFKDFRTSLEVSNELQLAGDWYFGTGCAPHSCSVSESAFAIHKSTGAIVASMLVDGDKINSYGVKAQKELPPPLYKWYRESGGKD